jgi:glucose 1-dehydrogenase
VQLENKVAAVTGSSLGIGRAIALAFAREGASVAINYRSHPEQGQEAVEEIEKSGGKAISVQADVSEPDGVRNLIQQTVNEFGRLDVMVNNAGIEQKIPFLETPLEVWEKVISVNLTGVWLGCQEAARQMVSQGDGDASSTSPRYTRTCPCRRTLPTVRPKGASGCSCGPSPSSWPHTASP